jgi:hypothetical protein
MSYTDSDDSVNAQILDKISEYFLNLSRIDRIPKLDIIRELSTISDIHSVDVQFLCKNNEDYHSENMKTDKVSKYDSSYNVDISNSINNNYDPSSTIGIDPVFK